MVKVQNLTNSPYDLQGKDGVIRVPAMGEVEGEFQDDYLAVLEASMAVRIVTDDKDGQDSKKGASKKRRQTG